MNDLERLARAICHYQGNNPDWENPSPRRHVSRRVDGIDAIITDFQGPIWRMWVPLALAILTELRTPSDEMISAGRGWYDDHERSYTAMIDHIIAQGK